jgi:4'-phosphopantetheinyl transferase
MPPPAPPQTGATTPATHARGRVSLWWAPLDVRDAVRQRLEACLPDEELRRADQLRGAQDRRRFVAFRGWRRRLLGEQLGCDPAEVPIVADDRGKPRVEGDRLRFSAARSAGLGVFATRRTTDVGVDVEAVRSDVDVDGIAARFFSDGERRALQALDPARRRAAFFSCWTCKEAYGKGTGVGLGFPLHAVEVWSGDGRPVTVDGWTIHQVRLCSGFAAAVAGGVFGGLDLSAARKLGEPISSQIAQDV